jgi:hypothetical protein
MMRQLCVLIFLFGTAAVAQSASCRDEVAVALERQRHTSGFRMKTRMLAEQGLVRMTVDYVQPNRMRQVITSAAEPKPVETVVIGREGWTRIEGEDWRPLSPQVADAMAAHMQETLGEEQEGGIGDFDCLGQQPVADKNYLAYQGENVEQQGPPGAGLPRPKVRDTAKEPGRPVRVLYVDPTTGLPMRSIFALANKLDKPIYETTYTYPVDIAVDAPPSAGSFGK